MAWIVFAVGALRLLALWASEPMLALANNYDMIRVQACIDAYPNRAFDVPPEANSYEAPIERYRFQTGVGAPCFVTSEVLFAGLAWPGLWLEQRLGDGTFSIRWVGAAKLAVLLLGAGLLQAALGRAGGPRYALGHALMFALVVADPGVGIYLNGFYAEFAAALFAYLLLGLVALALARHATSQGTRGAGVLIALFAVLLASAKVQHLVAPVAVLVALGLAWPLGLRVPLRVLVALGLGAALGLVVQGWHLATDDTASMRRANKINTVFYAMLPESRDAVALARALDLPTACAALAGSSWFTPGMQEGQLCPEALELRRADIARALMHEPTLAPRLVWEAARRSRPWIPPHLGVIEGDTSAPLPLRHPSLDHVLRAGSDALWLGALVGLPLAAVFAIRARRARLQAPANAVLAVCAVFPWISLAVVVLGDGFADTPKQSHLGTALFLAGLVLVSMLACAALVRMRHANGKGARLGEVSQRRSTA